MDMLAMIESAIPKTGEGWAAAITAICTLITTIWIKIDGLKVKSAVKNVVAKVDDAAATAKETTEVVAKQTEAAAKVVVQQTEAAKQEVVAKIQENTQVNERAISEANNFNRKLAETKQESAALAARLDKRIDDIEVKHETRHQELKQLIEAIKAA